MWRASILLLCTVVFADDWDLLIFTQHWPLTACAQYKEQNPNHSCIRPSIGNSWMIHGVWPTKLGTLGPSFCGSKPFNLDEISNIYTQMLNLWPNLEGGKPASSLWEHEWLKHGTCAATLPSLTNENEYFTQGLKWFSAYNMNSILSKYGIVPSQTTEYDVKDIINAIQVETGGNPSVRCYREKVTKKWWLFELRICFDKAFNVVDCDGTAVNDYQPITNCPFNQPIMYPGNETFLPLLPMRHRRSTVHDMVELINLFIFLDWLV